MQEKYYFDTSIWLDLFENRGRNSKKAFTFIEKAIKNYSIILFSELTIKELKHLGYSFDEVTTMFSSTRRIIRKFHIYKEEINFARRIASQRNIPKGDALHAILAKNNEAQLISRDVHFIKLRDITIAKKPEEII